MSSIRSLFLALGLLAGLSLVYGHRAPAPPLTAAQQTAQREEQLSIQLRQKGEEVLLALGHAPRLTVSVRCSTGFRSQHWRLYPSDADKSRFGYVVLGLQVKDEKYRKSSGGDYDQGLRSEKRDYSQLKQDNEEGLWIERIGVCAVIPEGDRGELEEALAAALGLDPVRGDTVRVVVRKGEAANLRRTSPGDMDATTLGS